MECPEGKLYPFSIIILYIFGLSLLNINFSILFNKKTNGKLIIIINLIFLFFIIISKNMVNAIKNTELDNFVSIFIIGVILSLIKLLDISEYIVLSIMLLSVILINIDIDINKSKLINNIVFLFLFTISLPNIYYNLFL